MRQIRRRATMADVADAAGVSLKTVSRHVNGETNIDPAICVRISAAIASLNFRRNLAAASIRPGQRSQLVGLIIEDIANPFYAALTRAVERVLRERGMLLLAASSEEDPGLFCRLVEQFIERRVDGLIVVPPATSGSQWPALAEEIPALVLIDRSDDEIDADTILADDESGAHAATELLINCGSRRIAFVGEALAVPTVAARFRGYSAALTQAGLTTDTALILDGVRTTQDTAAAVTELLAGSHPVDGIFTANNRASIGVLRAFRGLGTRRAMVGFDDFEAASLVEPGVTVVTQNVPDMGRLAAETLLRKINGDLAPAQRVILPTTIIRRGSEMTAPGHFSYSGRSSEEKDGTAQ